MFKIRPFVIFGLNILLMIVSWVFHFFPRGDEYLIIFMIPLIFIVAPFVLELHQTVVLLIVNFAFFIIYRFMGVLNPVDIAVLMTLLGGVTGGGYLVRSLHELFCVHNEAESRARQREYNSMVNDLEGIDRRGRKIESELTRISRLYEITKKLAPALKFEDLLDALFNFLEENFKFNTTHLLMFSKGKLSRSVSKSVGHEDYYVDSDRILDYEQVSEYAKKRQIKPFFVDRGDTEGLFDLLRVREDTLMVFPLFVGDNLGAILAIEGASRPSYSRFRILVSQIALEFRKVELYEQVQQLSIIDGLTEVYLRRYLMERLEEEVDRAGRLGLTFSISMIDIDHFKDCNDKYGHLVGDVVLKKVSEKLKNSVREVDMVGRYGGEEFCIIFPETPKELALTVAERLRMAVASREIKAFDESIGITISLGVATYPEDGKDVNTMIERADTALYRAKRKGRNAVCSA